MRADQLLLQRELASSRSQAQRLIGAGVRWRLAATAEAPWRRIVKNSDDVPHDAHIELLDASEARYVSRGGLKLEGGLATSGVSAQGKVCLDVGQSTGGFTDCLLRHGALHVVGIDVGTGQLHPSLRDHAQVLALEQINARDLDATMLIANYQAFTGAMVPFYGEDGVDHAVEPLFDLIVGDLSFISQTLVLPALMPLLKPGGEVLMLVKPQFELQPGQVGKGGIVKDVAMFAIVEGRIRETYVALGLHVKTWFDSPIDGGDGNREFFVHASLKA
jgi:23S rRNA (cytidine1920-2'-O)/16S rRNA (cytidine1409-2'-O)-methyltransferase